VESTWLRIRGCLTKALDPNKRVPVISHVDTLILVPQPRTLDSMSDKEQDTSVLGKRGRNSDNDDVQDGEDGPMPAADADINQDDSNVDVGPMPMPAGANGGFKKKRRGGLCIASYGSSTYLLTLVVPQEKLYLEHLPDAEQYYKSFMHRDSLNFVVVTK
jgi:peptidylprolyl isomerase domain and WD repeat-containing protein 1